jgi:hypothetical protein
VVGLTEDAGPLQIIQMQSGLVVLEIPAGKGLLKLALPPGRYLVQRREGTSTYAREISVAAGATSEVSEGSLMLVGKPELVAKGPDGSATPQQPATPAPPSTANRHLGFFLRLDTGPAFLYASEPYQGTSRSLNGAGLDFGFSIGGALGEDNILAAHFLYADALNPTFSPPVSGSSNGPSDFTLSGFGPEFTHYFMPLNVYLSGAVLLTTVTLANTPGAYGGDAFATRSTKEGIGLKLAIGKEWWVGDHWGLGIAAHYALSWNSDNGAVLDSGTLTTNAFTIAFSVTYN